MHTLYPSRSPFCCACVGGAQLSVTSVGDRARACVRVGGAVGTASPTHTTAGVPPGPAPCEFTAHTLIS